MKKFLISMLVMLSTVALAEVKEGTGLGYADDIKVAVTMDGDKITAIEVKENSDTPGISNPAIEEVNS